MSAELTLGAEEELHLIDLESWKLSARAPQLLSRLPREHYSAEIQRTTVETNTAVVDNLAGLRAELIRLRRGLAEVAAEDDQRWTSGENEVELFRRRHNFPRWRWTWRN